jgi:hypothetical protein
MSRFKLKDTLSTTSAANGQDVLNMKNALTTLGEYQTPSYGMTQYTDDAMFTGMKNVQRKNGLQVDGVARPGGPTETVLNSSLAEQALRKSRGQTRTDQQTNAILERRAAEQKRRDQAQEAIQRRRQEQAEQQAAQRKAAHRRTNQALRTAQRPQAAERQNPLTLFSGVGEGQQNRPQDIIAIKNALSWTGHYPVEQAHRNDGRMDEELRWGLWGFQRDFNLTQHGFSRPNGQTELRLNEIITPQIHLARREAANNGAVVEEEAGGDDDRPRIHQAGYGGGRNGAWGNPGAWAMEQAGRQVGKAVGGAMDDASEGVLRGGADAGRAVGLDNAADSLDHFLDGSGETVRYTREEARERAFIQDAEAENQRRFEESLLQDRTVYNQETDEPTEYNYREQLLSLEDGETRQILPGGAQPNPDAADFWDVRTTTLEQFAEGNPDEALAFGSNQFSSSAIDGFTATRDGDTVTVTAVVNHDWTDRYDFDGESSPDPMMNRLIERGHAAEFDSVAGWAQKMTMELQIVDGELEVVSTHWEDLEDEPGP